MKTEEQKINYALKPDAQAFDEIRIRLVPRFKDSRLSGSEWRISTQFEFFRNGEIVHRPDPCSGNMEVACGLLFAKYVEATDNGNGYYAGDGFHCDQEGCKEVGKYLFKIKQDYCSGAGNCGQKKDMYSGFHRLFCEEHKHRGDSDLQDRDSNYELVKEITFPLPMTP